LYSFDSDTIQVLCIAEEGTEALEDATVIFAPKRRAEP
jgi:hypothetical protein